MTWHDVLDDGFIEYASKLQDKTAQLEFNILVKDAGSQL